MQHFVRPSGPPVSPGGVTVIATEKIPALCSTLEHFRLVIRDALRRWNDLSAINTYFISIDGLSGSGKSTLAQTIRSVVETTAGVQYCQLPVDHFVATARDSLERHCMTDCHELFWKYIFDRQTMIDVAQNIVRANGAACTVPVQTLYNREMGSVQQGIVSVAAGRKVVLIDGIDSTRIMEELAARVPCLQLRVLALTDPVVALERAARRDRKRSLRGLEESREYRRREFQYLIPQILGQNITHVDLLYME